MTCRKIKTTMPASKRRSPKRSKSIPLKTQRILLLPHPHQHLLLPLPQETMNQMKKIRRTLKELPWLRSLKTSSTLCFPIRLRLPIKEAISLTTKKKPIKSTLMEKQLRLKSSSRANSSLTTAPSPWLPQVPSWLSLPCSEMLRKPVFVRH